MAALVNGYSRSARCRGLAHVERGQRLCIYQTPLNRCNKTLMPFGRNRAN